MDYDDEIKDPDYSVVDSKVTKSYDHIIYSPVGKFIVEENESSAVSSNKENVKLKIDHTQTSISKTYKRKLQFTSGKPKSLTSPRKQVQKTVGSIQKETLINQADFKKVTTKQLVTLRFIVDSLVSSLQNIEQKVDSILKCLSTENLSNVITEPLDDDLLSWPLESEKQLEELEQLLKNDEKQFKSSLIKKLSLLNSNSIERSVRRTLKFMFTDELLQNYSYTGFKKPKKPFSALLSCQAIIDSIRMSPNFKTATLEEIEKPIKAWLAQAKFRKN